ncbi:MAG: aminotransferase class V-fold PLP-dependent enzyme [Acidobacteria bacterium]|jgi:kynureninase|nr:aminotransferase class V-fold PLP-dependent enzyme [Acidobacteriota bacterium]
MTERSLASYRTEFPILEHTTYLVSHSLGAMPRAVYDDVRAFCEAWATRGVRAWHEGWWDMGRETGDLLAPILGVGPGTISMHQNVAVALGIILSACDFSGTRNRIVVSDVEFPSNLYLFENWRKYGAEIVVVESPDGIHPATEALLDAIDERTVLVPFSYVLFRSSAIQDARAIIDKAHSVGARVVADAYQAAGTIPLALGALEADFAVGGSVKWLCGGPGAGYLYVRPDLVPRLEPALVGWAAHRRPFDFAVGAIEYADGLERFQSGTPNVPTFYSARAGYRLVHEVGLDRIRAHSLALTRRVMDHADARGWRVRTPRADAARGGTVTIDLPNGESIARALIAREVIVDYRPGAGIRMAPHYYTSVDEIELALGVLDELVAAMPPPADA